MNSAHLLSSGAHSKFTTKDGCPGCPSLLGDGLSRLVSALYIAELFDVTAECRLCAQYGDELTRKSTSARQPLTAVYTDENVSIASYLKLDEETTPIITIVTSQTPLFNVDRLSSNLDTYRW